MPALLLEHARRATGLDPLARDRAERLKLIAVVDHHTAHPPDGDKAENDIAADWRWAPQIIDALLELKAVTDTPVVLPDPNLLAEQRAG